MTALAQTAMLPFKPVTFDYSKKLDRLILVSTNPNRLHIYAPASGQTVSVTLSQPPLSLSLSPDGLRAAVGHDARISYVDLERGALLKEFPVGTQVDRIVLSASWIYSGPRGSYGNTYSTKLETGESSANPGGFTLTSPKLNIGVNAIYGTRDSTSPNDVEKCDISTGPVTGETDSPYHGDYCIYGPVWFSPDWSRIYTGCGTIFRASTDKKLDMYYMSSIPSMTNIAAFDESAALKKIALLRGSNNSYYGDKVDDATVFLFESAYLNPASQLPLSAIDIGGKTVAAHGRGVFFTSDSTELIVVKQADASSGLLNDYAVQRIALSASGPCGAAFERTSIDLPAEGAAGAVKITAPATCSYQATSMAPWITLGSGAMGSGNGTLNWSVGTNPDSITRTGTVILPGQILTFTQAAAAGDTPLTVTPYYAVDAAYAKSLDKLVLVSANPNQLHIHDPWSRKETIVPLSLAPVAVSVHPDGTRAAVGHDGWVTLVDLNTASVVKVITVPTDVYRLILAANGYAYLFPKNEWGDLFSLNLTSGEVTRTSAIYNGREPRLHPNGRHIYVGGSSQSKWDISGGTAKPVTTYSGGGCGKIWLTEDGRRMFGDCAKAYTTSEVAAQDYVYNGSLSETSRLVWLDESALVASIAAIPSAGASYSFTTKQVSDNVVQIYNDAYLGYMGAIPLPSFTAGGTAYPAHGRFVFWNKTGTTLYAIVQADSKAMLTGGTGIALLQLSDGRKAAITAVNHGATQVPGRVTPGEVVTIYGSGLGPAAGASATPDAVTRKIGTNLAGTEVYINGVAAPVLFASDTQVNAIVPFESGSSGQSAIQVANLGILSPPVTLTMAPSVPGIFTMNGSGTGQAVAVNLDGTVCDASHPAAPGAYILVYYTGGGTLTPNGTNGAIASALKRTTQTALVTVGDVPATVSYSGIAPSFVEGVYQLNLKLDEKTPAGPAQALILTIGNNSSPATATIAVQAPPK